MMTSTKLFNHYFNESVREFKSNFKIYLVYVFSLCIVSLVQNGVDLFFLKNDVGLKIISKIIFSIVPILILSKILYVIKIRQSGTGEYGEVVWNFLRYNLYYFFLVFFGASLYFSTAVFASSFVSLKLGFLVASFLLAPLIYIMIFYSLSPFAAVFNDESKTSAFLKSKELTQKNIPLVIVNHLISLIAPILFSLGILISNSKLKFLVGVVTSVPEATVSILLILTTTKIYFHLYDNN